MEPINSSKNKLNSKINFLFNMEPNAHFMFCFRIEFSNLTLIDEHLICPIFALAHLG